MHGDYQTVRINWAETCGFSFNAVVSHNLLDVISLFSTIDQIVDVTCKSDVPFVSYEWRLGSYHTEQSSSNPLVSRFAYSLHGLYGCFGFSPDLSLGNACMCMRPSLIEKLS